MADGAEAIPNPALLSDDDQVVDGAVLKRRLRRAEARRRLRAFGLVAPLLFFILITFVAPIADMLLRSVQNDIVPDTLPRTVKALESWDPSDSALPPDAAFTAMVEDLQAAAETKTHMQVGRRLNFEKAEFSSLFRRTGRQIAPRRQSAQEELTAKLESDGARAVLTDIDKRWADPEIWGVMKAYSGHYTSGYFLTAVDLDLAPDGTIQPKPEDRQIYITLFERTLIMSVVITVMTLLLGYPVAYLLSVLPLRTSNLLMILVLLPFWTSLLVRTSAWIILLQQQGVVNDILVFTGANSFFYTILSLFGAPEVSSLCQNNLSQILGGGESMLAQLTERMGEQQLADCTRQVLAVYQSDGAPAALALAEKLNTAGQASGYGDERFAMMFNQTGTIVAMTHILLPFMILPLYSVMKTVPPSYVRAAKSLGATNWTAFWRVYFPNTVPGIGAGAVLVFILAIGYYITPQLVGGTSGTFISNEIARHIKISLNWGLGAALGSILLIVVLILYYVYDRIVGIDNVKLG